MLHPDLIISGALRHVSHERYMVAWLHPIILQIFVAYNILF